MEVKVPTARECMTRWFVTLSPDTDIFDAIDLFVKKRTGGAPVVAEDGSLVGILTEKDCLRVVSNSAYAGLKEGTVAEYMSPIKMTLDADMDMFMVAEQFLATNFVILPVLEHGKLVGRISRADMLGAIQDLQRLCESAKAASEKALQLKQHPGSIEDYQRLAASTKPEHLAALFSTRLRE